MLRPLIIAAPASGSGKTTVTLGLMAALTRRGHRVAPFKVGPDYIDPGLQSLACGRPARNLDGWMCGEQGVHETFARGGRGCDVAVVEGVMGLFDGASGVDESGSTAEIAKWLNGRVVLVVDARSQARSVAALVSGFVRFEPELDFAGIIFNRVGSERHEELLRDACASVAGLPPVLGCIGRDEAIALSERHLGLVTAEDGALDDGMLRRLADVIEASLDLDGLTADLIGPPAGKDRMDPVRKDVRIGVARDRAFCFYYQENLELLEAAGAELVPFSPLDDPDLPPNLQGLYLGGGYPELHAEKLSANRSMRDAVHAAVTAGLPVYAECGGLVYLSGAVESFPMVAVFPATARMLARRSALGYREICLRSDSLLGPVGTVVRGHEFHYSELHMPATVRRVYRVASRNGRESFDEGYNHGNVLASYVHLHFGSNPRVADEFVTYCRRVAPR